MVLHRGAAALTRRELVVRSWYGRRRVVLRSAIARAALVQSVRGSSAQTPAAAVLLILDRQGRCLQRLQAVSIGEPDLKAFAAALDVPVDVASDEMGAAELGASYPGSVHWRETHQTLFVLMVAAVVVVAVLGVLIALGPAGMMG